MVLKRCNFGEKKTIHTPPLSPSFKVELQVAPTVAQKCMEGLGEGKLYRNDLINTWGIYLILGVQARVFRERHLFS